MFEAFLSKLMNLHEPEVQKEMLNVVYQEVLATLTKVNRCESLIEKIFAIHFLYAAKESGFADSAFLLFEPQKEIYPYRVDFFISAQIGGTWIHTVVECDGHEFHEKTRSQVAYDKKRERDLKHSGYEVIRFSGSEITANPNQCAMEAIEIMRVSAMKNKPMVKASGL